MSGQLAIRYHKWNKSDYQGLSQSILQHLGMKSLQFYMPIFSLYFYIHNTPNSQKTIDFERKYYIHRLLEITKQRYYNSNILGRALIYDSGKNTSEIKDVFCKTIPILDPMHVSHNPIWEVITIITCLDTTTPFTKSTIWTMVPTLMCFVRIYLTPTTSESPSFRYFHDPPMVSEKNTVTHITISE